jgi:localization factor PodJL
MHNLAVLVAEGVGSKPDYATAIAWFRRAAQHGIRDSQFNLAVLLARGLGTPQDLAGSYTWFAIVATQGDEDAAKKRDEVGARLAAAELAAAKLAAERWRPEAPEKFANEVATPAQGWSEAPQRKRTASAGRL